VDASLTYLLKDGVDKGFIGKNANFIKWVPIVLAVIFVLRSVASFISTYAIIHRAKNSTIRVDIAVFFGRPVFQSSSHFFGISQ
ncbi:MAG: hypothetical protein KUG65_09225, partial [Sphingomonadaceae bacterium]|nr:hypothetical protein [Sphingomonadaceae bacterium]